MKKVKLLAFAGSLRAESFNKKLVKIAAIGAEAAGADVTVIDLKDYALPLYDEDIEKGEGFPENALKLKELFEEHDGLLIASPEYNSGYSGVLKMSLIGFLVLHPKMSQCLMELLVSMLSSWRLHQEP